MQLIAGGAGKGGGMPAPPAGGQPGGGPAGAAPMSTPQPAQGDKQSAMVNVSLAMDLLEQTLPSLGSESEEGRTVLNALSSLSKKFGHSRPKSQELVPAELMQLMQSLPQAGGMSTEQKAMGQQPIQMPGGMPGGMPGAPGGMH
jgi:hypothetical protein